MPTAGRRRRHTKGNAGLVLQEAGAAEGGRAEQCRSGRYRVGWLPCRSGLLDLLASVVKAAPRFSHSDTNAIQRARDRPCQLTTTTATRGRPGPTRAPSSSTLPGWGAACASRTDDELLSFAAFVCLIDSASAAASCENGELWRGFVISGRLGLGGKDTTGPADNLSCQYFCKYYIQKQSTGTEARTDCHRSNITQKRLNGEESGCAGWRTRGRSLRPLPSPPKIPTPLLRWIPGAKRLKREPSPAAHQPPTCNDSSTETKRPQF
jgi:hypothetical protein